MPILDNLLKMDFLVVMDLLTCSWIISLEAAFFKKGVLTVIPRFTRLLWQPKKRVNRNSRYTSHSIDKKCLKNVKKISIKLKLFVLMQIFLDKDKKSSNRKPHNGKPRKTRDYCICLCEAEL